MKRFANNLKHRRKSRAWVFVVLTVLTVSILATYASVSLITIGYRHIFPDVSVLTVRYPVPVAREGARVTYTFQERRPLHWVTLSEVSSQAIAAILASEDSGFYEHHGYEPESIRDAMEHNSKPGVKIKRGGSTITQQLVKNLFLSPEKTFSRKIRELLLAVELERKVKKVKILETYLNIAEWGRGLRGIDEASRHYFGKPPSALTAYEGAVLAFLLPNPVRYENSIRGPRLTDFAQGRVNAILEILWKTGKISDEEYTSARNADGVSSDL